MPVKFSGLRKAKKRERSRKSQEKNNTETGPAGNREEGQRWEKSREEGGREEGSECRDEAERSAEGRMVWSDQSLGHPRSPGSPGETERDLLWNLQGSIFHRCPGYRIPRPGKKNQIAFFLWCRVMGLDGREGSYLQEKVTGFHLRLLCGLGAEAEWEEDRLSGLGEYKQKPATI